MATEKTLKNLLNDNRFKIYINSLDRKEGINFFKIVGADGYEIRHSNFLAWLLDPKGNHGLKDQFLRSLLAELKFSDKPFNDKNFGAIQIFRERDNLDILILDEKKSLLICIENKIGSPEGYQQLLQYRKHIETNYNQFQHRKYVYLTIAGNSMSSDDQNWHKLNYGQVATAIQKMAIDATNDLVSIIVKMYVEIINELLVDSIGGNSAAYELYEEYKPLLRRIAKSANREEISLLKGAEASALTTLVNMVEHDEFSFIDQILSHLKKQKGFWAAKRDNAIFFNTPNLQRIRKPIGLEGYLLYCCVLQPHSIAFQMYLHPASKQVRTQWNAFRDWLKNNPLENQKFQSSYGYFTFFEKILLDLKGSLGGNADTAVYNLLASIDSVIHDDIPKLEAYVERYSLKKSHSSKAQALSTELANFIQATPWTFAKTYAETWPHHYIVKERVDADLFVKLVKHIRKFGYEANFYRSKIIYFEHDGDVFWTMVPPEDSPDWYPPEDENIINRCPEADTYESRLKNNTLPP